MLTLYHAPRSRSTRVVHLLEEIGADYETVEVTIARTGEPRSRDAANPHPEGKVPVLDHDGALVWESAAIMLYLTDLFPEAGFGPAPGEAERGPYISWLAWYAGVFEPVFILDATGLSHPLLHETFRGKEEMAARLARALEAGPYLLGERYSAADLLIASPFGLFPQATPDVPAIRAWVERCHNRPVYRRVMEGEAG